MKTALDPHALPGLRPPSQVMTLAALGAMMPTRLSFLRTLLRRLQSEQARVTRPVWQIDAEGYGRAVYTVQLAGHSYSLVAIASPLDPEKRTDRVIAEAWDATFVLYDGTPDAAELDRIAANAPLQEAGRFTSRELVLSRANKSLRLFEHVVTALKSGGQPEARAIAETGYLMRTTAVYGNGKFGIADRARLETRPGLDGPFAAEMLTVWLIRGFTHDLAEHLGGAPIAPHLKRHLGIGNSTGLGMAPFLVTHPQLLNNWVMALETARARVLAVPEVSAEQAKVVMSLAQRASAHLTEWAASTVEARVLRDDWAALCPQMPGALARSQPFEALAALGTSAETGALLTALMLEANGPLVDGLTECMGTAPEPGLDGAMSCAALRALIETHLRWALTLDFGDRSETARFWYTSEEKLEPRLGDRYDEPGSDRENPLDIARRVQALYRALEGQGGCLAELLLAQPEHRFAAERVQRLARAPYAEIQGNLIAETTRPIDMLRAKLSLFGAAKFDPRSDRWLRVTLAQGMPMASDLGAPDAPDGWLPAIGS